MNNICNALRETPAGNHDEICTVLAGVAAWLKGAGVLSSICTLVVIDAVDEALGQVEQDKVNQQAEVAWAARDEMPGFAGTYARLGALNLQGVAV